MHPLVIYLLIAGVVLVAWFFMEGLTDGDSDFFHGLVIAMGWPVFVPVIAAYGLGVWVRSIREQRAAIAKQHHIEPVKTEEKL